jgi:transcriptional regulator with XRE-family HTH domain
MPNSSWQISLGAQIRAARKAKRVKQMTLAAKLGVNRETVRLYETGRLPPSLESMRIIIDELKTEFTVDGCYIGPSTIPAVSQEPTPPVEQMEIDFDHQFVYRRAVVSVRATPKLLIVQAKASE